MTQRDITDHLCKKRRASPWSGLLDEVKRSRPLDKVANERQEKRRYSVRFLCRAGEWELGDQLVDVVNGMGQQGIIGIIVNGEKIKFLAR